MSDKFRGRFMALLTRKLKEEGIVIFNYIRDLCFDKDWVVYSRPPAKGVDQVLEYIARYAYRVAITNSRILDVTDSNVSYDYKDYRKGGKHGVMTMEIDKFLGLLSLHVLPDRVGRLVSARTVIASVSSSGVSVLPRGLRHSLSCVRVTK